MKYRAGKLLPWTRVPYGYRVDPEHPRDPQGVRIDDTEAATVRDMFEWYAQAGRSLFGLAHHPIIFSHRKPLRPTANGAGIQPVFDAC